MKIQDMASKGETATKVAGTPFSTTFANVECNAMIVTNTSGGRARVRIDGIDPDPDPTVQDASILINCNGINARLDFGRTFYISDVRIVPIGVDWVDPGITLLQSD